MAYDSQRNPPELIPSFIKDNFNNLLGELKPGVSKFNEPINKPRIGDPKQRKQAAAGTSSENSNNIVVGNSSGTGLKSGSVLETPNPSAPIASNRVNLATSENLPELTNIYGQDNYKNGTVTFGGKAGTGSFSITGPRGKQLGSLGESMDNLGDGKGTFTILGTPGDPDLTEQSGSKIANHAAGMARLRAGLPYDASEANAILSQGPTFYSPKPSPYPDPMKGSYSTDRYTPERMIEDGYNKWQVNAINDAEKNRIDRQTGLGQLSNQSDANQINREQNQVNLSIARSKALPGYSDLLGAQRLQFDIAQEANRAARLGEQNRIQNDLAARRYLMDATKDISVRASEVMKMIMKAKEDSRPNSDIEDILSLAREMPGMSQGLLDALVPQDMKKNKGE